MKSQGEEAYQLKQLAIWKDYQGVQQCAETAGMTVPEYLKQQIEEARPDPGKHWRLTERISQFPPGSLPKPPWYEGIISLFFAVLGFGGPIVLILGLIALALFG